VALAKVAAARATAVPAALPGASGSGVAGSGGTTATGGSTNSGSAAGSGDADGGSGRVVDSGGSGAGGVSSTCGSATSTTGGKVGSGGAATGGAGGVGTGGTTHVAFQVKDPAAIADWCVRGLGFRVARHDGGPANTHFLADEADRVVLELYDNAAAPQPDYAAMHPFMLHVAFAVEDITATHDRLVAAGATSFSAPETAPSGDQFAMLRDPFGLPLQLVRRKTPLIQATLGG
jgi:glyoxylase I family protein